MNDDLNLPLPPSEPVDPAILQKISAQLEQSPRAVRPLPSDGILMLVSLGVFLAVSVSVAAAIGFKALAGLSANEMGLYYGSIALYAVLFSRAIVERMIPGDTRRIHGNLLWLATIGLLAILILIIYADRGTDLFVSRGIPCLRTGLISAVISGALGWGLFRRGYFVTPRETLALYGFFAGLVGIAVLALHCPQRNSFHFLVWHLGAMLIAGFAGLLIGRFVENRIDAD